jgi:mannan endo-1,4-beta-mannosidase
MDFMPFRWVGLAAAGCLVLAGCGATHMTAARPSKGHSSIRYIGVIAAGVPGSYTPVAQFRAATGAKVNLAGYYSGWGEGFQSAFAATAWDHGADTLVDVDPPHGQTAMGAVADGQDDGYIRQFAEAIRAIRHPVVLDFGHEMNGDWSGFGYPSVRPATFVAAYRHVYGVFQQVGAEDVTWVWAVDVLQAGATSPDPYFPGNEYVDWVGIDGYDWTGTLTFQQRFDPTLAEVRRLSTKPVLISETSVLPTANAARQVTSWLTGIEAAHLLGLVWFDVNKTHSAAKADKHDWRLQDDPAGLAAFRAVVDPRAVANR